MAFLFSYFLNIADKMVSKKLLNFLYFCAKILYESILDKKMFAEKIS